MDHPNHVSVTPLDVVRVRLQSQPVSSSLPQITKLGSTMSPSFGKLPPDLGVTACCREVFWVNNNAQFCMAGPKLSELDQVSGLGRADCAVEAQRRSFNSTFDGLRKIARNEGITTLWRGLSPTLVMTIPANIIYFTGYDWLRHSPQSPVGRLVSDGYTPLLAGSTARVLAAMVVSPVEMFRTRMQASSAKSKGHFAATLADLKEMVQLRGYSSLWRGLGLTCWRDVPFSGLYWWGYETIRGQLTEVRERSRGRGLETQGSKSRARSRSQSRENHTATLIDSFVAGAVSGAVASVVTMPFDVGKTRQQVFKDTSKATDTIKVLKPEQLSMPRFLFHIFKEEGAAGLWRGWIARTLKVAPACAIMISCYEVGKRMARSVNEKAKEESLRA